MTPTIDQIEAALPYVPAGLHCGDLTEPDERRAFAEVVHGIVVAATETAPESRESDEQGSSAPTVPGNEDGRNNGVTVPEPDPVLEALLDEEERIARQHRIWPPPHPTDVSIAWGISEALIEENAR